MKSAMVIAAIRTAFKKGAPPDFGSDVNKIDREGAYEYGRLAIGSLITTAAGALVALLAYAGSVKGLSATTGHILISGVTLLGIALMCALMSAIMAYLNQAFLAFWGELVWMLWIAIICAIASMAFLVGGAVIARKAIENAVGTPAKASLVIAADPQIPPPKPPAPPASS